MKLHHVFKFILCFNLFFLGGPIFGYTIPSNFRDEISPNEKRICFFNEGYNGCDIQLIGIELNGSPYKEGDKVNLKGPITTVGTRIYLVGTSSRSPREKICWSTENSSEFSVTLKFKTFCSPSFGTRTPSMSFKWNNPRVGENASPHAESFDPVDSPKPAYISGEGTNEIIIHLNVAQG